MHSNLPFLPQRNPNKAPNIRIVLTAENTHNSKSDVLVSKYRTSAIKAFVQLVNSAYRILVAEISNSWNITKYMLFHLFLLKFPVGGAIVLNPWTQAFFMIVVSFLSCLFQCILWCECDYSPYITFKFIKIKDLSGFFFSAHFFGYFYKNSQKSHIIFLR